jgi:hypothetical protein
MRAVVWPAPLVAVSIGCATTYTMSPVAGGKIGKVESAGLQLLADANAWNSRPYDLPEYLTPVRVQVTNGTNKEIAIRYDDFSLTDENGFRYAPINPYGSSPGKSSSLAPVVSTAELAIYRPAAGGQRAPWHSPAPRAIYARDHFGSYAPFYGGHGTGFFIVPSIGFNFAWYAPWPYGFYYPPDYGAYVYPWGYPYYPRDPTEDILRAGLPEGVLEPNGHVSGFVYFQNAGSRAHDLSLTWIAHTPAGEKVGELSIAFKVEH